MIVRGKHGGYYELRSGATSEREPSDERAERRHHQATGSGPLIDGDIREMGLAHRQLMEERKPREPKR